ncbi:hypothetical protein AYK21_03970 [Thermoplasmatales archaeon SG8-52-2]|nr:MAG: hypothetical protein AYK21_03970 [Thermoplasmatales archaeon SG8-52-2]
MLKKIIVIFACFLIVGTLSTAIGNVNNYSSKPIDNIGAAEVIDQQQTIDCGQGCPFFSYLWLAQGFTPTLETITKVELKLFKIGDINSDILLSIRSSLTGSDLTSVSVSGNQVAGYGKWILFDFNDISINPNQMYYIVCRTSGGSMVNYYCCLFQINNPYSGGEVWGSLNSGTTWEIIEYPGYPDPDGCFIQYGLDESPSAPDIDGPTQGMEGEEYTYKFLSTDPEDHDVFYSVSWGDGTNSGWQGPFNSGEEVYLSHIWSSKGEYTILAQAKDVYDVVSEWGEFELEIPRFKTNSNYFIAKFIEQFPLFFRFFYD